MSRKVYCLIEIILIFHIIVSIYGILMSSMASLSAGIDPRHSLFWGNYITAPLIFTIWYLYKSHGCSKYLPWPFHWLTFWFGGQSSTVLQDIKKHNSEGVTKTILAIQSYLIERTKSSCWDKHTYCLRRRSFWNSFRSFSSVGNSYRSSKTHL